MTSTANPPSRRTHGRRSARRSQTASPIVSSTTAPATSRWPCSYLTPPTQPVGGVIWKLPNEVGQSGTESPASFEVTRAPAISRRKVENATKVA